jgi:hypothetical protein
MATKKFTTGLSLLSYAHVLKPAETLNGDMKYSASLVFAKNSDTAKRAKEAVAELLANEEVKKLMGKTKIKYELLRDGDEKDDKNYEGC